VAVGEELYRASPRGDLFGVQAALRNGANVNIIADFGDSPLHAASRGGYLDIVRALLNAGADTQVRDALFETALHDSCARDRLEVVRELVRKGADVWAKCRFGRTPYDENNDRPRFAPPTGAVAEFLLQHYQQKIFENEGRRSLLMILKHGKLLQGRLKLEIAVVSTDEVLSILRYFVEQDPDSICERDDIGNLPLRIACRRFARLSLIRYLLQQDTATLHISNDDGALPIHLACDFGALLPVFKYLVEENNAAGTLCARDCDGNLPLHALCGSNEASLGTFEYLTKAYPAALKTRNSNGALPLHVLCESPNPSLKVQ